MKEYKKLNETTFEVKEVKELKDTIDAKAQLELLAQQASRIKSIIGQVKQQKDVVVKTIERYNTRVDILNEAKDTCHLAYKELEKIKLPEDFKLEDLDPEKDFPKIDIKRDPDK